MKENPNSSAPSTGDPPTEVVTANGGDPLVGKVLDNRYKILSLIARGGMGRVYRAEQSPLGRVVALKVLELGKGNDHDREMRQRFMLEAATCSRLTHPNTIRIFDYGRTWDDILYIAMEFLEGITLHQAIRTEAPMAPERVVHIARQVCRSLREAHAAGLIHRDLKPSNVMLTRNEDDTDFVKLLDFGLVRELVRDTELTHADAVVGSPSYMSPEQIRGEKVDQRSDIYSVGILLYACLTGRTPFAGDSSVKVMMAHLNNAPPPMGPFAPQLARSPTLEWIVLTALAKEAHDRFATVDELIRALKVADAEMRGERPPRPQLVAGKLSMPDDWVSQPSMAGLPSPSGISGSGVRPSPLQGQNAAQNGASSEPSVSMLINAITGRRLPIIALTLLFLAILLLGVVAIAAVFVGIGPTGAPTTPTTSAPAEPSAPPSPAGSTGTSAPGGATASPPEQPSSTTPAPTTTTPATTTPASTTPASTTPASTTPAGTTPAAKPVEKAPKTTPKAEPAKAEPAKAAPAPTAAPAEPAPTAPKPETPPAPKSGGSDLKDPWSKR